MKNVYLLFVILASCGDSSVPSIDDKEKPTTAVDTLTQVEPNVKTQTDSLVGKTVPFLDIAFLERLESADDDYLNARLSKHGFTRASTLEIDDGITVHFLNKTMNNTLTLTKTNYQDGAAQFIAEYVVTEAQVQQFEANLAGTSYRANPAGVYSKKGLGTYVEKTIRLSKKRPFSIRYVHYMGKETSVILPEALPTIPNL